MIEVIRNRVRCKKCNDVIESFTTHDFKWCKCHSVAVDGGHEYMRRCGDFKDMEELSIYIKDNIKYGPEEGN